MGTPGRHSTNDRRRAMALASTAPSDGPDQHARATQPAPRIGRAVFAAVLLLSLVGAGVFGYHELRSSAHAAPAAPTVVHATHAVADSTRGRSIVAPQTVDGMHRMSPAAEAAATAGFRNGVAASGLSPSAFRFALYTRTAAHTPALISFSVPMSSTSALQLQASVDGLPAVATKVLTNEVRALRDPGATFGPVQAIATGSSGGAMRCQRGRDKTSTAALCAWADMSFVSVTVMIDPPAGSVSRVAADLRKVEEH